MYLGIIIGSAVLIVVVALLGGMLVRRIGGTREVLLRLVGFSSGALLGGVFFHLLPELIEEGSGRGPLGVVLGTIVIYLFIEKFLFWRHCHGGEDCQKHPVGHLGYMNLLGDGVHNFLDGIIIASAYSVDFGLGVVTTLTVALHEVPQEMGDLGVLLYSGFKFRTAIIYNILAASSVVVGAVVGHFLINSLVGVTQYFLSVAIGGFLYIAISDMLPILREETDKKEFLYNFIFLLLGALMMAVFSGFVA
ncbi:MAG: Zinc/iron permease [Parcubacteria group bacterium GW2011_GWB1_46_8]|nr:MAG: Zinc/iron permease [Parcubacteria group bacterium GW2011_GWF1_45_5]KKU43688.1 MAG: Zinc/iron permease [Parcubacteria group bacterium GW2011_GWA2_46_7]KKU46499.1 MAG: Zinc/iron permease [Parcubacteria group bacterium GW2011_GWB1_46_8]